MTLTYFKARSIYAAYAFEWEKKEDCHSVWGKLFENGQKDRKFVYDICTCPRAIHKYENIQVYQISGEH